MHPNLRPALALIASAAAGVAVVLAAKAALHTDAVASAWARLGGAAPPAAAASAAPAAPVAALLPPAPAARPAIVDGAAVLVPAPRVPPPDPESRAARPRAAAAAPLATELLVEGVAQPVGTAVLALPNGTRFQLRLRPAQSGTLELAAAGAPAPLWRGAVRAGVHVLTPVLRLQGDAALETLRLALRAPDGRALATSEVRLWHP